MELVELLLATVGIGTLFGWQSLRRVRYARGHKAFLKTLDPSVEIVLGVAEHEARARAQTLSTLHLLYGLLQDEDFVAAIAKLGGDAAAIEQTVHAALDRRGTEDGDPRDAYTAIASASMLAQQYRRQASCSDLWNYLGRTDAAKVVEVGALAPGALLFLLTHRLVEPPAMPEMERASERGRAGSGATAVNVVLRNDDYTTREFVVAILRDVFGLAEPEATAIMSATHRDGRAIVGRFALADAKLKIDAVRAKARDNGFPLWIGAEAC